MLEGRAVFSEAPQQTGETDLQEPQKAQERPHPAFGVE